MSQLQLSASYIVLSRILCFTSEISKILTSNVGGFFLGGGAAIQNNSSGNIDAGNLSSGPHACYANIVPELQPFNYS